MPSIKQILTLFFALSAPYAVAQDSLRTSQRFAERQSLFHSVVQQPYQNPALQSQRYTTSLSTITLWGKHDKGNRAQRMEAGTGTKGWGGTATMYTRMKNKGVMWGEASYLNTKANDVRWNETADIEWIYPYLMADTVGGYLKEEAYHFKAGYGQQAGAWNFGGEMGYSSSLSFRAIDPRPRNTPTHLYVKAGASRTVLGGRYHVGLSAEALKYKQSSSLEFYNPLGGVKIWQLAGVGVTYVRFDGNNSSVQYSGAQWGAGVQLLPTAQQGISLAANYRKTSIKKKLTALNDLPINELNRHDFTAELSYVSKTMGAHAFALQAQTHLQSRKGQDNIFGDGGNAMYPYVSSAKNYDATLHQFSFSGTYMYEPLSWRWSVQPALSYTKNTEKHLSAGHLYETQRLKTTLTLGADKTWTESRLSLRIYGSLSPKIDGKLVLSERAETYATSILQYNYAQDSASHQSFGLSAQYSLPFYRQMLLHIGGTYQHQRWATDGRWNTLTLHVGISL